MQASSLSNELSRSASISLDKTNCEMKIKENLKSDLTTLPVFKKIAHEDVPHLTTSPVL